MCVGVLPMSVQHLHVVPPETREGAQSPGTEATDSCSLP